MYDSVEEYYFHYGMYKGKAVLSPQMAYKRLLYNLSTMCPINNETSRKCRQAFESGFGIGQAMDKKDRKEIVHNFK